MLLTQEVEVTIVGINKKYYEDLGYEIPKYKNINNTFKVKRGTKIKVKVKDLQQESHIEVIVKCDNCLKQYPVKFQIYNKCVHEDKIYYCKKCRVNKSFEQWCIENNRQDVLNRWDYDLNNYKPSEISYSTHKKYYFKCSREIHKSELKDIKSFINGSEGSIECKACNSFAQWGIDNICEDFLKKYWDYSKNKINPWEISYGSKNKVWIKCQEKEYHNYYDIRPVHFINGKRCGYCNGKKVHPLDSLQVLRPDLAEEWHEDNKIKPNEVSLGSHKEILWKCKKCNHKWMACIRNRTINNTRCSKCNESKGETKISEYLDKNNFIRISQDEFKELFAKNKISNNYYIPQKKFENLIGIRNGLLSYDFYLPNYNILIEYQGEFHDGNGNYYIKQNLKKQEEHDKLKYKYAQNNNIKLLEIWYYDFDKIEEILNKELGLNKEL